MLKWITSQRSTIMISLFSLISNGNYEAKRSHPFHCAMLWCNGGNTVLGQNNKKKAQKVAKIMHVVFGFNVKTCNSLSYVPWQRNRQVQCLRGVHLVVASIHMRMRSELQRYNWTENKRKIHNCDVQWMQ